MDEGPEWSLLVDIDVLEMNVILPLICDPQFGP